jgi:uncharacterized protein YcaQ
MPPALAVTHVRRALLFAQGLGAPPPAAATKDDVLATIRRIHALQIDTISVVARSPYLVLWSRLGDYDPRWLDELLADGALFEYWAHAACMMPIHEFGLYRRAMLEPANRFAHRRAWVIEHHALVSRVRERIIAEGPLRSADFERTDGRKGGGWWDWKEEKTALEALFNSGELMVLRREGFQRLYDLRERVHPTWEDSRVPSAEEAADGLILHAVRALGIGRADWVRNYLYTVMGSKVATERRVAGLLAGGQIVGIDVEGWKQLGLVHPENLALVDAAGGGSTPENRATLLSPFDPIVADRARALELFGFDYTIECYTPEAKRRYGYFTLPILYGESLVGRVDAKVHRKHGLFEVKALHLEPGVKVDAELVEALRAVFVRCARWHGASEIVVRRTDPQELHGLLGFTG